MKLQYFATDKHIADVFMKPLAKVKFEYLRENLVFSGSRFPLWGSDKSVRHSNMVRGLGSFHGKM